MKELVIKIKWGGLGDHLIHTPIPRAAKQQGYDKVFISNHSDYLQPDTKKFIWGNNPFVDGFIDEDGPYPTFGEVATGMNILDTLVFWWGLDDDSIRFREPEIFYTPKNKPELNNAVIFDPNFGTAVGHPSSSVVKKYFSQHNICINYQMALRKNNHSIHGKPMLQTTGLEHFCDIIHSCKALFCFTTGTATLAAALAKSVTVFHTDKVLPMFHHSKLHTYKELK